MLFHVSCRDAALKIVFTPTSLVYSKQKELNLYDTRGITPKRAKSNRVHLRDLAPGQHSSKKTSQRWLVVGDIASNITDPGIQPKTSRPGNDVFTIAAMPNSRCS